jgi:chitodextrinase
VTLRTSTEASLTVAWSPSTEPTGVAGYGMYLDGVRVDAASSAPYTFTGLACNKTYTVGVDAVDPAGNRSTISSTMLSTSACSDKLPPTKPTGLAVSNITGTTVTFSWLASTDAVGVKGYDVYVGSARAATTTSLGMALGSLTCGTSVVLGVEAFDASGNRSQRATLNVTLAACAPKPGGDLYVSASGSDGGSCTQSAPCGSLGKAYRAAAPGQRIVVSPGSYPDQTIAYDPAKDSSSARVTVAASGATFSSLTLDGAQHLAFGGMTVTGRLWLRPNTQSNIVADTKPVVDVEVSGATLGEFLFRNASFVTLRDSTVGGYNVSTTGFGVPKIGAYLPSASGVDPLTSRDILIERVRFHDIIRTITGSNHAECLYLDGGIDGLMIRQSTFTNCGVFDVFGEPSGGENANVTLENNVFDVPRDETGAPMGSALNFKEGPGGFGYPNLKIQFNSILGNIRADSGSYAGASVVGNTLDNTACSVYLPGSAYARNVAKVACGATDIRADPQFVSASRASCDVYSCRANDLRLKAGSPAINVLSSGPSTDNYGTARPIGSGFDAGADEAG